MVAFLVDFREEDDLMVGCFTTRVGGAGDFLDFFFPPRALTSSLGCS